MLVSVAEWLRRQTRNLIRSRAQSNPVADDLQSIVFGSVISFFLSLSILLLLPATLGRSYAAIHCRIESMKVTAREVARFTFYWLLGAKRMLPIPDFLIAVARSARCLSTLQSGTIIDYCCGLVVIDNETNTFRLAHPTVRE